MQSLGIVPVPNDLLSLAQVVSSETMNELIEVARFSRQYQERLEIRNDKSDNGNYDVIPVIFCKFVE